MKKVAIYARVSTDSQSCTNQLRELRSVADRNGWQVIEEQDDNKTTQATYVYGLYIDEVLNMQRDVDSNGTAEDYYFHSDDLYNVMAISDSNGNVVERYEYDDYGKPHFFDQSAISNGESEFFA